VVSVAAVCSLLAIRLLAPAGTGSQRRPLTAGVAGLAVVLASVWAVTGPYAAGWSARAGGRHAHPARLALAPVPARRVTVPSAVVHPPFTAPFSGRLTVGPVDRAGRLTVRIDGALRGVTKDHLEILIHGVPLENGGVAMEQSRVRMGTTTPLYRGTIVALQGTRLVAAMRSDQQRLQLGLNLQIGRDGRVEGAVHATRGSSGSGAA
jgi:hypothetical protein